MPTAKARDQATEREEAPSTAALLNEITAVAGKIRRGHGIWFDRLPPEWQEVLRRIRDSIRDGTATHTKTSLAKGAAATLKAHGVPCPRWQEIVKWFDRED